ncbi:MAG: pyridoxamine 5'-phosphate oxidase family protein [Streptococcaceae bacterium]|jgi:hypothetical protein|nr:pyridoxamine 5'-phosphate oxidase family protein [Streptococcaceae bacterium]
MYFKRFLQLFVIYVVSAAVLLGISGAKILSALTGLGVLAGYAVLTLPLVVLTIVKANKKAAIVGTQSNTGELSAILKNLPGYIALSIATDKGVSATTIMSFTQDTRADNIFYTIAAKDATKVTQLQKAPAVSFTTWFDSLENGARLSSNNVHAEVFLGDAARALTLEQPNLIAYNENAANSAIIKLTIHSALYENFKDGLKVLSFD